MSIKKLSTKEKTKNKSFIIAVIIFILILSVSSLLFIKAFSDNSPKTIDNVLEKPVEDNTINLVNKKDLDGMTPIMRVLSDDDKSDKTLKDVYNMLKKDVDFTVTDNDGKTLLMYAAFYGNKDIILDIVKKGADINALDDEGRTALHWASFYGKEDAVKELISLNANLRIKDKHGLSALDLANFEDHPDVYNDIKDALKRQ